MNDAHRKARLKHLIETDYGRQSDFVRATGISKSRLSQMVGSKEPFGEGAARRLADELNLHENWFNQTWLTPKEAGRVGASAKPPPTLQIVPTSTSEEIPSHDQKEPDYVIPQYNVGGSMGNGRLLLSEQPGLIKSWRVDYDWLQCNVPTHTGVKNLAIVTGFGPSMIPMFNPGDPLLVDTGVKTIEHDGVYFFRIGDEGYIKLVQRVPDFDGPGFVLRIISKNPDFPPFDISPKNQHFAVLAKVITVWRSDHY